NVRGVLRPAGTKRQQGAAGRNPASPTEWNQHHRTRLALASAKAKAGARTINRCNRASPTKTTRDRNRAPRKSASPSLAASRCAQAPYSASQAKARGAKETARKDRHLTNRRAKVASRDQFELGRPVRTQSAEFLPF